MAFTKTPIQSSAQTQTMPLLYQWDKRAGKGTTADGQDTLIKNAVYEPVGQEYFHVIKRDGITTEFLSPAPTGPVIGTYFWDTRNTSPVLIVVYMDNPTGVCMLVIYNVNGISVAGPVPLAGVNAGDVLFDVNPFLYQNGNKDLLLSVGNVLFKIDGTTLVATLINVAAATVNPRNSILYLDGYAVIHDQNNIYTSQLNDPTTWPAANFIAADSYADFILKIARSGPYIVAFGNTSIQYYFDAGNPTGSPLSPNVGATKHIGYIGGFAQEGDDIYFVGAVDNLNPMLYKLSGLKCEPITSIPFTRIWNARQNDQNLLIPTPYGSMLKIKSHSCYFVRNSSTVFPVGFTPPANLDGFSYIYDLDSQMWSKLGYQSTEKLLIKSATPWTSTGPLRTWFSILGDSNIYSFGEFVYQDNSQPMEVRLRTRMLDFGTMRTKFGSSIKLMADQTPQSSNAFLSWSDNDYKTTSTPRPVDMQYAYQQLFALGSFRHRSFTLTYSDNLPIRFRNIELDYDQGNA